VVLFHAGVPALQGGFAGVDVFFVISGYLITSQLLQLQDRGAVSLLREFYARRVRRILPALTLVVVATLALGQLLLLPYGERQELAKAAIAASLFASNVFFWTRPEDYFAPRSELQPLLHTWTISVEEQFYVLWPLAFLGLTHLARRWDRPRLRAWTVGGATLASFVACAWLSRDHALTAFYWLPTRAWEIGAGALLALVALPAARLSTMGGSLGAAAIVASFFALSPASTFPGVAAAVPVLGATLVIHAGIHSRGGPAQRVLSAPMLVAVGRVSYAWYLWHWPLISIARAQDLGERHLPRDLALAALALGLAFLTTHLVERPIRERRWPAFAGDRRALAGGAILTLASLGLGALLLAASRSDFDRTIGPALPPARACLAQYEGGAFVPQERCVLSAGNAGTIFLVGDSHADHWAPAVAAWARRHDVRGLHRALSGCPVVVAQHLSGQPQRCSQFSSIVLDEIRAASRRGERVGVLVANKWVNHVGEGGDAKAAAFLRAWSRTLETLAALGVRVAVIGPTPLFPHSVPECLARRAEPECRLPRARFDHDTAPVCELLRDTCRGQCRAWLPAERFCDARWCYPMAAGKLSFTDKTHLSRFASEASVPALDPYLRWLMGSG
jgi:peptidoglycan/LPS O-acetylase OafA/YrhL